MRKSLSTVALTLLCASTAMADGSWENLMTADGVAEVPGMPGIVWVPNEFNNPTIDAYGSVVFRGRMGGAGITTANSRVIMKGVPGNWSIIAREGSALPGGLIPGAVINSSTGINGLASSNNITADGGVVISGTVNGGGATTSTDSFNVLYGADGSSTMLAREGDQYPGVSGVTMSVSGWSSGANVTNTGTSIQSTTLTGAGVITTAGVTQNNSAVVLFTASGPQAIFRRGDAAPGAGAGDQWGVAADCVLQQDAFGLFLSGGYYCFSGKLLSPTAGTITAANDNVYLTNSGAPAGGLRIVARDGAEVPGLPGVTYLAVSTSVGAVSWTGHPIAGDGKIMYAANLGGAVTAADNAGIFLDDNGSVSTIIRRGDSFPGLAAGEVFSGPNYTAFLRSNSGMACLQGILMNADGSALSANGTFVGAIEADGTKHLIARMGSPVPGLPDGTVYANLNGNTSICMTDTGIVVFTASITGGGFPSGAAAIMAWDPSNGLRVLAKTGDTNFTGTPYNQGTLIGSTGMNGNAGFTGINANGMLVARFADSTTAKYTIARIQLDAAASNACPADLDGDGAVAGSDLGMLLSSWGANGPADLDDNGSVDGGDLGMMLGAWGNCPN